MDNGAVEAVDLLAELPLKNTAIRSYKRRETIYEPGSELRICVVKEGWVITEIPAESRTVGIEILGAGGVFGVEALAGQYMTRAICASHIAQTYSWSVEALRQSQESNPTLSIGLMQAAISTLLYLQGRIQEFALMQVDQRLARFLIELAEKKAWAEENGVRWPRITQEMLARFVGSRREIVSCYLNAFRRSGYVSYRRRSPDIDILDPGGLVRSTGRKREKKSC